MNIEVGSHFKTRDGRKAYVAARHPHIGAGEPCVFIGWIEGSCIWHSWGESGAAMIGAWDLVSKWREPITREGTLWLFDGGTTIFAPCEISYSARVIAKKTVRITEGEGM